MSSRRREPRLPETGDVYVDDELDPDRFFGASQRSRKAGFKTAQLCKQVERAVSLALASECESEALAGAVVDAVEPAPDAGRLRIVVAVDAAGADGFDWARAALSDASAAIRAEIARAIHRKRVPEIVFELRLAGGLERG